jgi:hypothetical protein
MINLFDDKVRVDLDPSHHNENSFNYYDRSARKDVSNVREKLNEWFSYFPTSEQVELKSRFKKTFSSAYFELFIHELFRRQGFEILIHPEVPNTSKRPDFLMKKESLEFYLEAKEAREKSDPQQALENRINQVYDSLNRIKSPNFFLKIDELILKTANQPSTKKAIANIETESAKYDPELLTDQLTKYGFERSARIEYEDIDLKLVVSLIPKSPAARGLDDGRAIGMYPYETIWGGSEESIKGSFEKKYKRYGQLDKPYIVCINAIGMKGNGDIDVENALWGSVAWTWSTDPNNRNERWERQRDGMFLDKKGPRCTNVSGVLVTKVMEFNIHVAQHWFAKHPYSKNEADFTAFDLTHTFVSEGKIKKEVKKTIGDILQVESTWLVD